MYHKGCHSPSLKSSHRKPFLGTETRDNWIQGTVYRTPPHGDGCGPHNPFPWRSLGRNPGGGQGSHILLGRPWNLEHRHTGLRSRTTQCRHLSLFLVTHPAASHHLWTPVPTAPPRGSLPQQWAFSRLLSSSGSESHCLSTRWFLVPPVQRCLFVCLAMARSGRCFSLWMNGLLAQVQDMNTELPCWDLFYLRPRVASLLLPQKNSCGMLASEGRKARGNLVGALEFQEDGKPAHGCFLGFINWLPSGYILLHN